jgi:SAM-dependent methyltransferase
VNSIYDNASLYNLLAPPNESEHAFFCELAVGAASILEIASGCGSLAARLAVNADVVGIDASAEMVAFSSAAFGDQPRVSFVHADMCDFRLGKPFDLVFAVDNALQHACTDEALFATLKTIDAHLGPQSRAVLQTGLRASESVDALNHTRRKVGSVSDTASGSTFEIFCISNYDTHTRINRRTFEIYRDGLPVAERTLRMRLLDANALQSALAWCGFAIEREFDGRFCPALPNRASGTDHTVRTYECRRRGR